MVEIDQTVQRAERGSDPGEIFCPEQLVARCLGKIDFARRVLDVFLKNLDGDIAELIDAGHQRDSSRIAKTAHRLKGSAASIAAKQLQTLMAQIEEASQPDAISRLDDLISRVQSEVQQLETVLVNWCLQDQPSVSIVDRSSSSVLPQKEWGNGFL